jgi:hypothetical protein
MTKYLLAAITFGVLAAVAPAQDAVARLMDAARAREAATQRAEFVYRVQEVLRWEVAPTGKTADKQPAVKESTAESRGRLALDGARYRLEDVHPLPPLLRPGAAFILIQNDEAAYYQFPREPGYKLQGVILPTSAVGVLRPERNGPLFLACRLASYVAERPERLALVEKADADGLVVCRLDGRQTLWADPAREYVVTRAERAEGKYTARYDIRYEKHAGARWLPSGWTLTSQHPSNNRRNVLTATVDKVRVGEPLPDTLFEMKFPRGMEVSDNRDGSSFLAGADGEKLPVRALPNPNARGIFSLLWRLGLVAVVGGLLFLALFLRFRRRKPAAGQVGSILPET